MITNLFRLHGEKWTVQLKVNLIKIIKIEGVTARKFNCSHRRRKIHILTLFLNKYTKFKLALPSTLFHVSSTTQLRSCPPVGYLKRDIYVETVEKLRPALNDISRNIKFMFLSKFINFICPYGYCGS